MRVEQLRGLARDELIERASAVGVVRPRVLTQAELIDEILKHTVPAGRVATVRGWLGRARDLLAQVVAKGLHLPDAAKLLSGVPEPLPKPPPPLPTVTLAEIYAAQGHLAKAIVVLDQVLEREPDHPVAAELRQRFAADAGEAAPAQAAVVADENCRDNAAPLSAPSSAAPATVRDTAVTARDEVAAVATDAATLHIYWQVRPLRYARVRHDWPSGEFVLRLVSAHSHGGSTELRTRDVAIDGLSGDAFVRGLPAGGHVRMCVGWKAGERLVPLCVAAPRELPHKGAPELGAP